jgi:MFS family permease
VGQSLTSRGISPATGLPPAEGTVVTSSFQVLAERPFRHVFAARAVSLLGTSMAPVALAFAILGQPGGSATRLGIVMAGRSVAQVAFMLFGGALADRFPRYRLMVGSALLGFAAQGTIAALFLTGTPPLALLTALSVVNGAAAALFFPASRGLIPQLVPGPRRQSANALIRLSENSASLAGAALSGVTVATIGSGWALAVDAATFLASAILVLTARAPAGRHATGHLTVLADLREGWQEFRTRTWVWVIVAQFALINLCFSPTINVLGPVVARQHWGGALAWSLVVTANAAGLIAGSLLAMRLRPAFPLLVATLATFGFLPPFFLLALPAPPWLAALSMLINGLTLDIFEVLWLTALQEHIPSDKLSRVNSYDALGSFALGPIGLLLVGPVSAALSARDTLIAAGTLVAIGNLAALLTPAVRRLPARLQPEQTATPAG